MHGTHMKRVSTGRAGSEKRVRPWGSYGGRVSGPNFGSGGLDKNGQDTDRQGRQ